MNLMKIWENLRNNKINLRMITADEYAILRHRNQFVLPKIYKSQVPHSDSGVSV